MMLVINNNVAFLSGDLSIDHVQTIWTELFPQPQVTELDFSGVTKVDSSSLGLVFALGRAWGERRLIIRKAPNQFLSLVELYNVSSCLVFDNRL